MGVTTQQRNECAKKFIHYIKEQLKITLEFLPDWGTKTEFKNKVLINFDLKEQSWNSGIYPQLERLSKQHNKFEIQPNGVTVVAILVNKEWVVK